MLDRRGACHAGSRAHVDQCAAEIGGIGEALFKERADDTVGRDTETIRKYIAEQEKEDRRLDQLEMPEITRE